jgi:hypothetical protein
MKNLVIDPQKHFPSSKFIFGDSNCDYYSPNIPDNMWTGFGKPPMREDFFRNRYGIDLITDWEILEDEYDIVTFIWAPHDLNDPLYVKDSDDPNTQERRRYFLETYNKLFQKKVNKFLFIDLGDRAVVKRGLDWLDQEGLPWHGLFKREYRTNYAFDYNDKIHPFPFGMWGMPNASWLLYQESQSVQADINSCFWAGGAIYRDMPDICPDEYCNRPYILNNVYNHLSVGSFPHDIFLQKLGQHKFFLHLNGTGHLCRRFFEGLSTQNSLMMMQYTDLVFPFDDGDVFSEETIFKTPQEFVEKLNDLKYDDEKYYKCLLNQKHLVNKYYNYEWIYNYINTKINI